MFINGSLGTQRHIAAISTLLVTFSLYLCTICPTVYWADSGEIVSASFLLGLPHPPAFPLHILLSKIFTFIPFGDIAFRVNLCSSLFGALTVTILFYICILVHRLLLAERETYMDTQGTILAFVSVLIFAFGSSFWLQSVRAEVYTLNAFLLSLIILVLLFNTPSLQRSQRGIPLRFLAIFSFTYGLSFTNHPLLTAYIAPGIILFFLTFHRRVFVDLRIMSILLFFFLLGITVYGYLVFRTDQEPIFQLTAANSWETFVQSVTRKGQVDRFFSTSVPFLSRIQELVYIMVKQFTFFLYWVGIIGAWSLLKKDIRIGAFLLLIFVVVSVNCMGVATFSNTNPDIGGYLIPVYMVYALWISYGLGAIFAFFHAHTKRVFNMRPLVFILLNLLVLFSPIVVLLQHSGSSDKRGHVYAYEFGKHVLNSIEDNAALFVQQDSTTFILWYLRFIEHQRQDAKIIHVIELSGLHGKTMMNRMYPDLENSLETALKQMGGIKVTEKVERIENSMKNFIPLIIEKHPVYLESGTFYTTDLLLPNGLTLKVQKETGNRIESDQLPTHEKSLSAFDRDAVNEQSFYLDYKALEMYSSIHNNLGVYYKEKGLFQNAIAEWEKTLRMNPSFLHSLDNLGGVYGETGRLDKAESAFKKIVAFYPHKVEGYYGLGVLYYRTGDYGKAIDMFKKAIRVESTNVAAYNELGLCYIQKDLYQEARRIWTKALTIDQNHDAVLQNLDKLKNRSRKSYENDG